jgi:hypothetical protein
MARPAGQVALPSSWLWNWSRLKKPPGRAVSPRCGSGGSATRRSTQLWFASAKARAAFER